jgi:hypothetical protein
MCKHAVPVALAVLGLMAATGGVPLGQAADEGPAAGSSAGAVTSSPTPEKVRLPRPDARGWVRLFNGKDLKGWYGDPKVWRVQDGYILGKAAKVEHNTFLIYNHPFADFDLRAKCMLIKGKGVTNSGIQYRSRVIDPKEWIVGGYQADMGAGYWGTLYEERGRGSLGKRLTGAKDPATGEWADYRIVAKGNHLKQYLNGVPSLELVDTDEAKVAREGIIALQYHAPGLNFEARFKDVRIKILDDKGPR